MDNAPCLDPGCAGSVRQDALPAKVRPRRRGHRPGSIPASGAAASGGRRRAGSRGQVAPDCHGWRAWPRTWSRQSAPGTAGRRGLWLPPGSASAAVPDSCLPAAWWLASASCLACGPGDAGSRALRGPRAGQPADGSLPACPAVAAGSPAAVRCRCAACSPGPACAGRLRLQLRAVGSRARRWMLLAAAGRR